MDEKQEYLTIADTADALGKTRQTIYVWLEADRFPNLITAGRVTFIPAADVEQVKLEEATAHIDALARLGVNVVIVP